MARGWPVLVAVGLALAGSGCKGENQQVERPAPVWPAPGSKVAAPPPGSKQAPVLVDAVDPLVPFPPDLDAETLAICRQLDADLRHPGSAMNRVAKFLGYQARCDDAAQRYRALVEELAPKLAAHRSSLANVRTKLDRISAPDRTAFWRWLGQVRVWVEDELNAQSNALTRGAGVFLRRCPGQARVVARLSRPVDRIEVQTRADLGAIFASPAAPPSEGPDYPAKAPMVPLPRGLAPESRALCQRFDGAVQQFIAALRAFGDLFREAPDCEAVVRGVQKIDESHLKWVTLSRELQRRHVALVRVRAADAAAAKGWHRRMGRETGRRMKRGALSLLKAFARFGKRCPAELKRIAQRGYRFDQASLAETRSVEYVLAGRGKGGWSFRWPSPWEMVQP